MRYCFDLWAQQVADFACQVVQPQKPLQLVGNSIGGIVALRAAQLLSERGEAPAQVILLNCAQRALDDRRAALLPIWERWSRPMVKRLVRQRWLLQPLFRTVARPLFVRQVLAQAYPSGANVDQDLIELLLRPARQTGAVESFRGFVNLFRDHMAPPNCCRSWNCPCACCGAPPTPGNRSQRLAAGPKATAASKSCMSCPAWATAPTTKPRSRSTQCCSAGWPPSGPARSDKTAAGPSTCPPAAHRRGG